METLVERACGLDVHQASVVACVLVGPANRKPKKEVRTFGTMTRDLLQLRDWLRGFGVTHVGMESTGVYWKPVYAILEDYFELIVGNARHIRNVPGRKTDVKDSEWIADLIRHGLVAKSFVPPKPLRELRELTRYRQKLAQVAAAERNRLLRLLETTNIKLSTVASDVFGVSGMAMLKAILERKATPAEMAQLAKGAMRKKLPLLERALEGCVSEDARFILGIQMHRIEQAEVDLETLDQRIKEKLQPYEKPFELVQTIPGIGFNLAAVLIAELGVDMSVFHSKDHLSAWAGVCPGCNESAGKHKGGGSRKGNVHLKTALVQGAVCAARTKGTYLRDKYHKLKARRGGKRATMAVAHKIAESAYHVLSSGQPYQDLGDTFLDELNRKTVTDRYVRRLRKLGYDVQLTPTAPADSPASTTDVADDIRTQPAPNQAD